MNLALRILIPLVGVIATVQALSAVYSDNSEIEKMAAHLGCPEGCLRTLEVERTPFAQNFVFQVSLDPIETVPVSCKRDLVLFGDYSCQVTAPPR